MTFEIDRPIHFLPQANFLKEDINYSAMELPQHHTTHQQNSSASYSPIYGTVSSTTERDAVGKYGLETEDVYGGTSHANLSASSSSSSSYHQHHPSSVFSSGAISGPAALTTTPPTPFYQMGSPYPELDTTASPLSSSPSPKSRTRDDIHQQKEILSPLPTNASTTPMYHHPLHQPPNSMIWKDPFYSSTAETNESSSWARQQQPQPQDEVYCPTTPTPQSSSGSSPPSPPHHYQRNMPPCNCASIMQYGSMYGHSSAAAAPAPQPQPQSQPYHDVSPSLALTPPPSGLHHSPMNISNSNKMVHHSQRPRYNYSHPYQRSSVDQSSYDPSLGLSSSSSSSSSDEYQQHGRPLNSRNGTGGNPITSPSSSSTTNSNTPRRYKCTVCVKRFTRPSSLATHMHSHTGEKPYKCIVDGCGRRFSVVSNLRRHAKIHVHANTMVGSR